MLTVMTLNLANYDDHDNWTDRLSIIVNTITSSAADVIAVQEVRFDPNQPSTQASYQNMAEQIVATLNSQPGYAGMALVTQPLMFYPNSSEHYPSTGGQLWEGISILSRRPITETGAIFLTRNGGDGNLRGTQYAAVTASSGTIYVFNTHFALDQPNRELNAQQTLAYMTRFSGPQLLLGDLNAVPTEPAISILSAGGLTDLWAQLEPDDNGYTYASNDPTERIDYCWANAAAAPSVQTIQLVATEPVNNIYASDHFGVLITIDV